jgi:hypothetical protein
MANEQKTIDDLIQEKKSKIEELDSEVAMLLKIKKQLSKSDKLEEDK